MKKAGLKKEIERLLNDLPEHADRDDLMYKIYVRQSIEQGLKDSDEGRVSSHDALKKKYHRNHQHHSWRTSVTGRDR